MASLRPRQSECPPHVPGSDDADSHVRSSSLVCVGSHAPSMSAVERTLDLGPVRTELRALISADRSQGLFCRLIAGSSMIVCRKCLAIRPILPFGLCRTLSVRSFRISDFREPAIAEASGPVLGELSFHHSVTRDSTSSLRGPAGCAQVRDPRRRLGQLTCYSFPMEQAMCSPTNHYDRRDP